MQTLGVTDTIDGGDGTDTMTVTLSAATTPLSISNVETIQLTSVGALTHNFAAVSGMTTFSVVGNTGDTVVNNLAGIATVNMTSNAFNLTLDYAAAAVSGTADSQVVNLSTVSAGTLTLDAAIETVTLNSGGSIANTLTALAATGASTLTITGAQDLTITNTLGTSITTVAASAATGDLSILQTGAQISNITTGAGDDTIDLSGGFVDLTATTTADTVAGGLGTDKLVLAGIEAAAVTAAAQFANVTGIEVIAIDDDGDLFTFNTIFLGGAAQLEFDALVGAVTVVAASGNEIQFDAADANAGDARAFSIAGVGTSDSLTLDVNGVDITGDYTFTGVETINLATSGTSVMGLVGDTFTMTATAATESLIVTGTGDLSIGIVTADVINTSGLSSTATFTMSAGAASAINFTGGVAAETVIGSAAADIINTGAGADTVTGGAGIDVIDLGASDGAVDTVSFAGVALAANANNVTSFEVGTGGDIMQFSDALLAVNAGAFTAATAVAFTTVALVVAGRDTANEIVVDTIANLGALGVSLGDQTGNAVNVYQLAIASDTGAVFYDADGDWSNGSVQIGDFDFTTGLLAANVAIIA